jgi:two-component system nitrogen regulation response regulator NtrX
MTRILIVDDEESIRRSLGGLLSDEGYDVATASDGNAALAMLREEAADFDLVLLDIAMPGGRHAGARSARALARAAVRDDERARHDQTAVRATRLGASTSSKPLSAEKLLLTLQHALDNHRLATENQRLRAQALRAHEILGTSEPIQRLKQQIAQAAPTNGWVLITGENGTGKELVARQIHLQSKRASGRSSR